MPKTREAALSKKTVVEELMKNEFASAKVSKDETVVSVGGGNSIIVRIRATLRKTPMAEGAENPAPEVP